VKRLVAQELTLSFVPAPEQRLWRTVTRTKVQLHSLALSGFPSGGFAVHNGLANPRLNPSGGRRGSIASRNRRNSEAR
jgi:hypothetical protein